MRTIFLMMDSLNKHYLNAYGNPFIQTPNLDRLFEKGVTFNQHYCASMPCMPARRDLFTGRMCFLESPWGSLEPWDASLPRLLREQGVYTHMITDHYHYFEGGGQNYVQAFDSWEFERGQEGDVWHGLVQEPDIPPFRGKNRRAYWVNRSFAKLQEEESYPTVRCIQRAMNFVKNNHNADNWHLHLELFDPHEPFVCPQKYLDMYQDDWDAYHFDWPSYAPVDMIQEGEKAITHIRKSYAAVLTMADTWLGKLFDQLDAYQMWDDTTIILTTDHGHLLGEHGYWAKNYMFDYQELSNIPLCIYQKGIQPGERNALSSAIDLMPTLLDLHNVPIPTTVQGKSLRDVLQSDTITHHSAVLFGYHGKDINMFNGRYTYCRQPDLNQPVYLYTLCTDTRDGFLSKEALSSAQCGRFLPYAKEIPQLKIACSPYHHHNAPQGNIIYDTKHDPKQTHRILDSALEQLLSDQLDQLLITYGAPCLM